MHIDIIEELITLSHTMEHPLNKELIEKAIREIIDLRSEVYDLTTVLDNI